MEIIRKRICIEDFISRTQGSNKTITEEGINTWGNIPKSVIINGGIVKYGTLMNMYYDILGIITKSTYYIYNKNYDKWVVFNNDWREIVFVETNVINNKILYSDTLPTDKDNTDKIIGLTNKTNVKIFYDDSKLVFGEEKNGFELFNYVNILLGKIVVPYEYDEIHVPYFVYLNDIDRILNFMNNLKNLRQNCCTKKDYKDYGGDKFYDFLTSIKDDKTIISLQNKIEYSLPTIDIPILLTGKLYDLGQYRTYDVDVVDIEPEINQEDITTSPIVKTKSESKFRTLRKRKVSVDDKGNELPGIIGNHNLLKIPYEEGYIKNMQFINNNLYGDLITSMKETCTVREITEGMFETLNSMIIDTVDYETYTFECDVFNMKSIKIDNISENDKPIDGDIPIDAKYRLKGELRLNTDVVDGKYKFVNVILYIQYGNIIERIPLHIISELSIGDIRKFNSMGITINITGINKQSNNGINFDINNGKLKHEQLQENEVIIETVSFKNDIDFNSYVDKKIKNIVDQLLSYFNENYPKILCLKQDYEFINDMPTSENNSKKGSIYISFSNPQIEVTYVLGAKLNKLVTCSECNKELFMSDFSEHWREHGKDQIKDSNDIKYKIVIDEINPFNFDGEDLNNWNGDGIWYRETYPIKKLCAQIYRVNDIDKLFCYDEIDFKSKETNYFFDGIDFSRKNYILCDDVIYKSETYKRDSTNDAVFKDEKMLGINFPLKEDYDVVIDRGISSCFDKHLQLCDVKTWQDMENYRNGMYLNK